MISRAIVLASAMSVPTSSPSQRPPTAPTPSAAGRSRTAARRCAPLEQVVEEDRVRLARVRAPEEDHVRLLDLAVGDRAAARAEHRRQTDDAGGVSGPVAAVDVVRTHAAARTSAPGSSLVRRLRAREIQEVSSFPAGPGIKPFPLRHSPPKGVSLSYIYHLFDSGKKNIYSFWKKNVRFYEGERTSGVALRAQAGQRLDPNPMLIYWDDPG